MTLRQPSHERNTNSPSTDEHKRVDALEAEQTLWEKGGEKKEKKKTVALETAVLPSTFYVMESQTSQILKAARALFNPPMPEEPPQRVDGVVLASAVSKGDVAHLPPPPSGRRATPTRKSNQR